MKVYKSEVVGIRNVNYQRKDGQTVNGQEIYFSISGVPDVSGYVANSVFHSFRDSQRVYEPGDEISIAYDRYASNGAYRYQIVE